MDRAGHHECREGGFLVVTDRSPQRNRDNAGAKNTHLPAQASAVPSGVSRPRKALTSCSRRLDPSCLLQARLHPTAGQSSKRRVIDGQHLHREQLELVNNTLMSGRSPRGMRNLSAKSLVATPTSFSGVEPTFADGCGRRISASKEFELNLARPF